MAKPSSAKAEEHLKEVDHLYVGPYIHQCTMADHDKESVPTVVISWSNKMKQASIESSCTYVLEPTS